MQIDKRYHHHLWRRHKLFYLILIGQRVYFADNFALFLVDCWIKFLNEINQRLLLLENMYEIYLPKTKIEKLFYEYMASRGDIKDKLRRLSTNPFGECGAHPLKGKLKDKWSCWLGSNIRMIYTIDTKNKKIIVWSIGNHKIY